MTIWELAAAFVLWAIVPGALVGAATGLRLPWALASAIPISLGIGGLLAWAGGAADFEVALASYIGACLIFALVGVIWQFGFRTANRRKAKLHADLYGETIETSWSQRLRTITRPVWLIPAAGVVASAGLTMSAQLTRIRDSNHGVENVYNMWDTLWHANVIKLIDDTGLADPTRMGELQYYETHQQMYYPTAWHVIAAVGREATGASPIAATNIAAVVYPAVLLPIAAAILAWWLAGKNFTGALAAAIAAIMIAAAPPVLPIMTFVGAYPYLLATACVPVCAALLAACVERPQYMFGAALALIGAGQAHPSAVPTVVLLLAVWWLGAAVWNPARSYRGALAPLWTRLRDIGLIAVPGLVAAVVLLPQWLSGSAQGDEITGFGERDQLDLWPATEKILTMATRHTEFGPTAWLLIVLGAVGAVVVLVWRRNPWGVVAGAVFALMAINAFHVFPEPWEGIFNAYSRLHYGMAHRMVVPYALFLAAFAGIAVAVAARLVTAGTVQKAAPWNAVAATVLTVAVGAGLLPYIEKQMVGHNDFTQVTARNERIFGDADRRGSDILATLPGAYDHPIFTNPDDGSGWMYAYNGLPSMFKHFNPQPIGKPGTDSNRIFFHIGEAGAGTDDGQDSPNYVDFALRDQGIRYVYLSPPSFFPGVARWGPELMRQAWHAPGLTPIYQDGPVNIFVVNAAFTNEEIADIRAKVQSPNRLPAIKTKGELGLAQTPAEESEPYFHRTLSY